MNLKTLDLNLLRVFDAIYGARNVSAAARLLGMRQSTVSASLARLRDLSGDHLFVRSGQGVKPTLRADAMAGPIREGLARLDRAFNRQQEFDPSKLDRAFRVAMHETVEPFAIRCLTDLRATDAPKMRFHASTAAPDGVADNLYNGVIDMALDTVPLHSPQITCLPMFRVRLVCAGRRGWVARHGPLDAERFSDASFVALKRQLRAQDIIERSLSRRVGSRRVVYETASYWSMATAVADSEFVAILPRLFFSEVAGPLELDAMELPFDVPDDVGYLIWHNRSAEDQGHRWLRRRLSERFSDQPEGVST